MLLISRHQDTIRSNDLYDSVSIDNFFDESSGDVIIEGGAGSGHAMLYVRNNLVIQSDPTAIIAVVLPAHKRNKN